MACRIRNERRRNQRTANLLNLKKKLLVVRVRTEAKSSKSVHEGEPMSLLRSDRSLQALPRLARQSRDECRVDVAVG